VRPGSKVAGSRSRGGWSGRLDRAVPVPDFVGGWIAPSWPEPSHPDQQRLVTAA